MRMPILLNLRDIAVMAAAAAWLGVGTFTAGAEESHRKAIERHIHAHSQEGVYAIYDAREGKALGLELDSIHETAHPMDSGEIFYCADFRGADGTLYDLDFYVEASGERPVVVESFIHKAGGKDRIRPGKDARATEEEKATAIRKSIEAAWSEPVRLYDSRQGRVLTLELDHVHSAVKGLQDGSYFACVDARDAEGVLYDLDTYVLPGETGKYEVTETIIHKRDGVERLR